jgi:hypothetical protein
VPGPGPVCASCRSQPQQTPRPDPHANPPQTRRGIPPRSASRVAPQSGFGGCCGYRELLRKEMRRRRSLSDQDLSIQEVALKAAGCDVIQLIRPAQAQTDWMGKLTVEVQSLAADVGGWGARDRGRALRLVRSASSSLFWLIFDLLKIIKSHAEGCFRLWKSPLQHFLELLPIGCGLHQGDNRR